MCASTLAVILCASASRLESGLFIARPNALAQVKDSAYAQLGYNKSSLRARASEYVMHS